MRNQKFVEVMGNKIGSFVHVDLIEMLISSKALKILVNCNLDKPLVGGLC